MSIRVSAERPSDHARTATIPADDGFEYQHNLAEPDIYAILVESINRDAINNAVLVNIGPSDKTEMTTVTYAANNRSGDFISDMVHPEHGHFTGSVGLRKLDDIWCVFGEPLNFIKIDVEGFESNVI